MATGFKACSIPGCKGNAHWTAKGARGWCCGHWERWRRHGDPLGGRETGQGGRLEWLKAHVGYAQDECLVFPFSRCKRKGYGAASYRNRRQNAHHIMCILAHGEQPSQKHEAAHSCGKAHEGCVNPKHLRWATRSESQMDRVEHGTSNRGERQGRSKLTADQVRRIRSLDGIMRHVDIGEMFGVCRQTVDLIITRKNWGWLD